MWRKSSVHRQSWTLSQYCRRSKSTKPVISIESGTFYRRYPSSSETKGSNPVLFERLNFELHNGSGDSQSVREYWSVLSPSSLSRTTFLQVLAGQHICIPPTARSYPYLSDIGSSPHHAIQYVGFDADRGSSVSGTGVRGAYLSARYESRREETDYSLRDYLIGNTALNALEREQTTADKQTLEEVTWQLDLTKLMDMPVANLSNGQTRRARIAKALMDRPQVLLLDGPFMGLDPNTLSRLSGVLRDLAERNQPRLIISLRPEDGIPKWMTHLVVIGDHLQVRAQGTESDILAGPDHHAHQILMHARTRSVTATEVSRDGFFRESPALPPREALIEMRGVKVTYGSRTVLGDWQQDVEGETHPGLWWSLHRGQRCGIFGPNGSGKTTMLSLITSDHPQTYSLPIKIFGKSRLPKPGEPGLSVFDLQKRMGHSSPEVHAFFPKQLTVRRTLESAWADAPLSKPALNDLAKQQVNACLRWFTRELKPKDDGPSAVEALEAIPVDDKQGVSAALHKLKTNQSDLDWTDEVRFGELSFSSQRLLLFLRTIVAGPDLVILDEAFSGMDEAVRDKALLFLAQGEKIWRVRDGKAEESNIAKNGAQTVHGLLPHQAMLVISHAKEDVPGCVREWICLPEPSEEKSPRMGTLSGPLELEPRGWDEIWGRKL